MIDEAMTLLNAREADHPANLLKAREITEQAIEGDQRDAALTLLAEILFWLGEHSTDNKEKEAYLSAGVEAGKQAVKANPDDVAANLWYAANMGAHGVVRGIMSSLFYIKDIDKAGKKALAADKTFFHGAPLRLLGRFYHQCPGFPIGPGDNKKAVKMLEEAVETGPDFYMNHVYLADALISRYKKADAKKLLQQVIEADPETLPLYHKTVVVPEAEKLIKRC